MILVEIFLIAISSIWSNKIRSFLTMLGIIIGISSVVTIISLGNATEAEITGILSTLGVNKVTLYYDGTEKIRPDDRLHYNDMVLIMDNFEDEVISVTPLITMMVKLIENVEEPGVVFSGVNEYSGESDNLELIYGRFINEFDVDGYKKNVIIDNELSSELFGDIDSTGRSILVSSGKITSAYNIVGVYEKKESLFGETSATTYVPYTTMDMVFNLQGELGGLVVNFYEKIDVTAYDSKIVNFIERYKGNEGENKYATFSAEDQIEMVSTALATLTIFVSAIAAISLLVGGIGVMNIMLVSVTERTKEIGIRKAMGAQHKDIMLQFLIEALMISLLGGIVGTTLGIIFINIAGNLMEIPATLSIDALILATIFSSSVGIFFGMYPANKAASLDPIEALRYE